MRRAAIVVLALAWSPAARAAAPVVSAQASAAAGPAPLTVTLTATGDGASYHWELGDGAAADGAVVEHAYAAGAFTATVTATAADGETATARVAVTAYALTLRGPRVADYGRRLVLRGAVRPGRPHLRVTIARDGRAVASGLSGAGGAFRIGVRATTPGAYSARFGGASSAGRSIRIRPRLVTSLDGPRSVGSRLTLHGRLVPAGAGTLRVRVWRSGRLRVSRIFERRIALLLPSNVAAAYRIRLTTLPSSGFAARSATLETAVVEPRLAPGARGPGVRVLEQRLHDLHYALQRVDGSYGADTADAVLAFQKVNGLARTGRVDGALWRRLLHASIPRARYGGDHVEVDKTRQVLFVVRDGQVTLVAHVSTGATGNTPVGTWHVYRKVNGWSWVLWYPMFFTGAFAIHGYPSVPAYPASHGCVRVPMWVAPRLFTLNPFGETIYVHV